MMEIAAVFAGLVTVILIGPFMDAHGAQMGHVELARLK
jgi:hypothetical protein